MTQSERISNIDNQSMAYEWHLYPILFLLTLSLLLYKTLIYPIYLSPLSRLPRPHPLCRISPAWILWNRYKSRANRTIHDAHQQLGPIVQLGPNEVSINSMHGGVQVVYAGNFEKHQWYPNVFNNFGVPNMFSTAEKGPHAARKRMLSNIYSKSYLQTSEPLRLITQRLITERFIPQLEFIAGSQTPVNFIPLFCAATMDFITAYQFGLARCADFLRDGEACTRFLGLYYGGRRAYDFWQQEMSGFTNALRALGIKVVPKHVRAANAEIEAGALQMCSSALDYLADLSLRRQSTGGEGGARAEDSPVVLAQLDGALLKHGALPKHGALLKHPSRAEQEQAEDGRRRRLVVASELLDHSAAGFETSAITLTYAVHELSRRPRLQDQLRAELYTLRPRIRAGGSGSALAPPDPACALPSAKDVDGLPLLHAVVLETLRRHPSIPGSQPRVVPKGGCLLDGEAAIWIPEGVRISAQPYSLHKDPSLFPRPLDWAPQRWLTPDRRHLRTDHTAKEMNRGFWAFSSGARMCVGSHFAMHEMKYLLAAIYSNFTTSIIDDEGIQQMDSYTAPSHGGTLILDLKPITSP